MVEIIILKVKFYLKFSNLLFVFCTIIIKHHDWFNRSLCSLVCKWNYVNNNNFQQGWDTSFFQNIGLEDLLENNCSKIGKA